MQDRVLRALCALRARACVCVCVCVCVLPLAEPRSVTCLPAGFFASPQNRQPVCTWAGVFRVRVWGPELPACLSAHKQIPWPRVNLGAAPKTTFSSHQKAKSGRAQVRVHATPAYSIVVAQSNTRNLFIRRNEHKCTMSQATPLSHHNSHSCTLAGASSVAAQRPCCRGGLRHCFPPSVSIPVKGNFSIPPGNAVSRITNRAQRVLHN